MARPIARIHDLLDPALNRLQNVDVDEARRRLLADDPAAVLAIDGLVRARRARRRSRVRLARSLDRPLRYFLAKDAERPGARSSPSASTRSSRRWPPTGWSAQFHPSYTRMVPAHHVTSCGSSAAPIPTRVYTRFFDPPRAVLPADLDAIGERYVGAAARGDPRAGCAASPERRPRRSASCFSGGIDSGAVLLAALPRAAATRASARHGSRRSRSTSTARPTTSQQAREFLRRARPRDPRRGDRRRRRPSSTRRGGARSSRTTSRSTSSARRWRSRSCRGIRERYPDWRHLVDGDGGDENLKDYPIEENAELTIRSVVNNLMLYQEGWGVDAHQALADLQRRPEPRLRPHLRRPRAPRLRGVQPVHPRRAVIAVAEAIPFAELTEGSHERAVRAQGRDRARAASAPCSASTCRCSPSGASSTARRRRKQAPRLYAASEAATGAAFFALYAGVVGASASAADGARESAALASSPASASIPWQPTGRSGRGGAPAATEGGARPHRLPRRRASARSPASSATSGATRSTAPRRPGALPAQLAAGPGRARPRAARARGGSSSTTRATSSSRGRCRPRTTGDRRARRARSPASPWSATRAWSATRCFAFARAASPGGSRWRWALETVHPEALPRLEQGRRPSTTSTAAAALLRQRGHRRPRLRARGRALRARRRTVWPGPCARRPGPSSRARRGSRSSRCAAATASSSAWPRPATSRRRRSRDLEDALEACLRLGQGGVVAPTSGTPRALRGLPGVPPGADRAAARA